MQFCRFQTLMPSIFLIYQLIYNSMTYWFVYQKKYEYYSFFTNTVRSKADVFPLRYQFAANWFYSFLQINSKCSIAITGAYINKMFTSATQTYREVASCGIYEKFGCKLPSKMSGYNRQRSAKLEQLLNNKTMYFVYYNIVPINATCILVDENVIFGTHCKFFLCWNLCLVWQVSS